MGSLVFFGIVLGSLIASVFMDRIPIKIVLTVSMLGNGFGMLLFISFTEFYYVCCSRFLSGLCQIVVFIYGPLFVDAYFPLSTRSFWLSIIVISGPLGTCIGFAFMGSMLAKGYDWRLSPILIAVCMFFFAIMLWFIPTNYIDH